MPRWIDVPAHRVLETPVSDFMECFDVLNGNGEPCHFGQVVYRIVRKSDGKLFRPPQYHKESSDQAEFIYLEEI